MIKTLKEFIDDQKKAVAFDKMRIGSEFIYDILPQYIELVDVSLSETEANKYRYNPKALSYDVYKTVDYWFLILVANKYKHVHEFNLSSTIKLPTTKAINNCITLQSIYGGKND